MLLNFVGIDYNSMTCHGQNFTLTLFKLLDMTSCCSLIDSR